MVVRCNPEWEGGNVSCGERRQLAGFRVMAIAKVPRFRGKESSGFGQWIPAFGDLCVTFRDSRESENPECAQIRRTP